MLFYTSCSEKLTCFIFLGEERFAKMKGSGDYYVTVIEDTRKNEIIGAATLVIEHKFIHDCGLVWWKLLKHRKHLIEMIVSKLQRARLEDVVVNDTYRGKQLGKLWANH